MTASPPATLTPRARDIVGAARNLLEAEGAAGLSMRRIAERLGIRAPSLYKHFRDHGDPQLDGRFPPGADPDAAWRTGIDRFRRHPS